MACLQFPQVVAVNVLHRMMAVVVAAAAAVRKVVAAADFT
jgi:hypothetical protein